MDGTPRDPTSRKLHIVRDQWRMFYMRACEVEVPGEVEYMSTSSQITFTLRVARCDTRSS